MSDFIHINIPEENEKLLKLKAGDRVLLSGYIVTGRDAAHKRLITSIQNGEELPINLDGQTIYYVGPAPAKPGYAAGSAGPTTSYRMDPYTLPLLERGLKGMIGKGLRSAEVIDGMKKHGAVYFGATGGAAALIAKSIKKVEVFAYSDLGPEAMHRFYIENFPVIVVIDSKGENLYDLEPPKYSRK